MPERPLRVAWISNFPVEWLPGIPEALQSLPRQHPATWQRVLFDEITRSEEGQRERGVRSAECGVKGGGTKEEERSGGRGVDRVGSAECGVRSAEFGVNLDVLVVRRQFPRTFSFDLHGATFHCLKLPPAMRTLSLFWWETLLIRRSLKRINPDLVHAWGTERGAALVASRLKYPYLVTMQGLLEWYSQRVTLSRYQQLEAKLERPSLRRASVITTESTFAVNWLRERYPHLEIRQAEHAANWLFHKLERRPELKPLHFLCVAQPSAIKGTDILLEALDQLRNEFDFRLIIVGSAQPEFLRELKTKTSASLWERVQMRNGLTQAEVAELMARASMVLFPTRADTSPNSVKEAVVAGVPVVASAVGGITDYVVSGQNGITVPPGEVQEFTHAVRAALGHPLFSRGQVDAATLARMRDYLSPAVMAEKFLASYERVLKR